MGGKLYWAPVQDPKRILDIGTGTGIWAMEVGRSHLLISYFNPLTFNVADAFPQADVRIDGLKLVLCVNLLVIGRWQ